MHVPRFATDREPHLQTGKTQAPPSTQTSSTEGSLPEQVRGRFYTRTSPSGVVHALCNLGPRGVVVKQRIAPAPHVAAARFVACSL